jgi:hypothetical protein
VLPWLLANLESTVDGVLRFRIPLGILGASINDIGAFPFAPGERTWEGLTLFVKGEKSECVAPVLRETESAGRCGERDIGALPFAPGERAWERPTLFVKGDQSEYIVVGRRERGVAH